MSYNEIIVTEEAIVFCGGLVCNAFASDKRCDNCPIWMLYEYIESNPFGTLGKKNTRYSSTEVEFPTNLT